MIAIPFLFMIAGLCEGVMDYLQFHYYQINFFWNPKLSWKNKWKNGKKEEGEKFFLSSTILVFLTDGWHLMKWCRNRSIDVALFIFNIELDFGILWALFSVVSLRLFYGIGFWITYKKHE